MTDINTKEKALYALQNYEIRCMLFNGKQIKLTPWQAMDEILNNDNHIGIVATNSTEINKMLTELQDARR